NIRFGGQYRSDTGPIDSGQSAQFNHARCHGRAGVASADNGVGLTVLDQIDRTTDGRIFFSAHSGPGAVAHVDHLGRMHDLDPTVVAAEFPHLRFDLSGIANQKEFADVIITTQSDIISSRMDKPYARPRCCHIASTYLAVAHANGWPLCAYATASSRFYVWGRPCQAAMKARSRRKTTGRLDKVIR